MLTLAFLAFVLAGYLTVEHYRGGIPPCFVGGCETVLTSAYAVILGVPTALWGMLYSLALFFLILVYRHAPSKKRTALLLKIVSAGMLGALGLVYLQAFVLRAFCQYCLAFEGLITLLFVCAIMLSRSTHPLWQLPGNST